MFSITTYACEALVRQDEEKILMGFLLYMKRDTNTGTDYYWENWREEIEMKTNIKIINWFGLRVGIDGS